MSGPGESGGLAAVLGDVWDRCVREVANVDPRAIHNPYRQGDAPTCTVDIAAAIRTIEFSRETHVQWRDWLRANPDDPRGPTVGDADYQQRCVEEYDNVLAALSGRERLGGDS